MPELNNDLLTLIDENNVDKVKDTLCKDKNDYPLHKACSGEFKLGSRRLKVVKLLVEHGADVNERNSEGELPLHLCIEAKDLKCVEFLLEKGSSVYELGRNDTMAISLAVWVRDKEILRLLMQSIETDLLKRDLYGRSIAHQIFSHKAENEDDKKYIEAIEFVLSKSGDLGDTDNEMNTPLHWAALYGNVVGVRYLIDKKVEIDALNKDKQTPLARAAWRGEINIIKLLIDAGAYLNKIDGMCNSVVNMACETRAIFWDPKTGSVKDEDVGKPLSKEQKRAKATKEKCISILANDYKVDVNFPNIIGMSPLMNAAKGGLTSAVSVLLKYKADVHRKDLNGRTALHHVFRDNGNTDADMRNIVEILRRSKCKTNVVDKFGNAAVHYAVMYTPQFNEDQLVYAKTPDANENTVEKRFEYLLNKRGGLFRLLEKKGDPNIIGRAGNTALHLALKYDKSETHDCIRILRYFGADYNLANNMGQTPLDMANETKNQDLVDATTEIIEIPEVEEEDVCCSLM